MNHAINWYDVGANLGLESDLLDSIGEDNRQQHMQCFEDTLHFWLRTDDAPTWKALEIALTNANRAKVGLDQIDDVYG